MVVDERHTGDALAVVDCCTWSQPRKGCNHRALIALVVVEQFHGQLQRLANAKEAVGPTAHEYFPVTLLLPDEVGDVENPGQAVEERRIGTA
ncbi:hypothetical protein I5S60_01805 [Pseudomonas fluorescens]|nr:hypothetical protein [Pseudomonas fluorescens]